MNESVNCKRNSSDPEFVLDERVTPKKCLVVLGMHRSGTSALMGALSILGVDIGLNPMSANHMNVKGFYENQDICDLNEEIFKAIGSRWDDPDMYPDGWWERDGIYERFAPKISNLIDQHFSKEIIGIKDPRLCRLFPLWHAVLAGKGIEVCCVIPIRNPLEVAKSWSKSFASERSILIWMANVLESEYYSRGLPRIVTTYSGLLSDSNNTLVEIVKWLDMDLPRNILDADVRAVIMSFLDSSLRHHELPLDALDVDPSGLIRKLYEIIIACEFEDCSRISVVEAIDDIRTRYARQIGFFRALGDHHREEKEALQAQLVIAQDRLSSADAAVSQRDAAVAKCQALELECSGMGRRILELDSELTHIYNSDFWAVARRYYWVRDHSPLRHVFNMLRRVKRRVLSGRVSSA